MLKADTIGMIGLGKMGHAMAANILKKGHSMMLYDVREEAVKDLLPLGAVSADSVAEIGQNCEVVLFMVNTYEQCKTCMEELLSTMQAGIAIVSSTIQMKEVCELEKMASARGIQLLDAPVSGGTRGAQDGTLTIMAAGDDEVFKKCTSVLSCCGTNILHVGQKVGEGQAIKAINQLLVGIHICAASEAFNLARQCGLDLKKVFETIKISAGTSRIFENRGQYFIDRDFSTRSTLAIQLKDTKIACDTAADVGAPAILANTCREFYEQAVEKYSPLDDSIAVIQLFESLNRK